MNRSMAVICMGALVWWAGTARSATEGDLSGKELVFVLAGQSNMYGTGKPSELEAEEKVIPSLVTILDNGSEWNPTNSNHFGPEVSFAREIAVMYPTNKIYLLKKGTGGTSLYFDWAQERTEEKFNEAIQYYVKTAGKSKQTYDGKKTSLYHNVVAGATGFMAKHPNAKIMGILWMQGEEDCRIEAGAKNYAEMLAELAAAFRRDLNAPDAAFVYGLIKASGGAYPLSSIVKEQQRLAESKIARSRLVDTTDVAGDVHFTSKGYLVLGKRFADAYKNIVTTPPSAATNVSESAPAKVPQLSLEQGGKGMLVFGNSYSGFTKHLPIIAESKGDKLFVFFIGANNGCELLAAEQKIATGQIKTISKEEALKMGDPKRRDFGWVGSQYQDKGIHRIRDYLAARKWDFISFQAHSSWANDKKKSESGIADGQKYLKQNHPDTKLFYYHTTQYRNDELLFQCTPNGSVYRRIREGYPYTEDQHYFDALVVALEINKDHGVVVLPAGTALQNARYDTEWLEVSPDPNFDYIHATKPAEPKVPRTLHCGFTWNPPKTGFPWAVDSHPNELMSYLSACVWYEVLFGKSCIGAALPDTSHAAWSGADPKVLQRVAHETVKGRLPPLRLMHPESRIQYGDILASRAETLLKSKDSEAKNWGLDCWQNLFAYIPEHPKAAEAKAALEKAGKLKAAQSLAEKEIQERPAREAYYRKTWDESSKYKATLNIK